jgi:hypothetical protein
LNQKHRIKVDETIKEGEKPGFEELPLEEKPEGLASFFFPV